MEPRARVSVWPGRRRVPGIVAPDSWGARGAECLPRDVLRRSSPATSPCDGTTARRCLCHGTGPAPRKHAPPQAVYPRRLMGVWGGYRATRPIPGRIFGAVHHSCPKRGELRCRNSGEIRGEIRCQFIILARKDELTSRKKARERCTDESQVPSIVMTASRRVQLGARRGRSGHRLRGMLMDAR